MCICEIIAHYSRSDFKSLRAFIPGIIVHFMGYWLKMCVSRLLF